MTALSGALPVQTEPTPRWWPLVVLGLGLPLLVLPALSLLPPLLGLPRYEVAGSTITARSVASHTVIPAGTPVTQRPVRLTRRNFGSSLSGYTVGQFSSPLGALNVYSDGSQATRALVFATQPRPTVLTPADPEALLAAWRSSQSGQFRPASAPGVGLETLLLVPLLPLVAFLFSRPRVRYELRGDELLVRTAVSTTRFPRADTVASLTDRPLGMRLFGAAMPGYYTGTFASDAGGGSQVQAAAGACRPAQALVLRRGKQAYYLTPRQPQELAAWFAGREGG